MTAAGPGGAPDARPAGRGPFWRVVRGVAGLALFLFALHQVDPLPMGRAPLALVAGLLLAGAMAVTDSAVGLLVAVLENLKKGR